MPRYSNGRIPTSALYRLDTGAGQHLSTWTTAIRWYLLRRNVLARTGVVLYITPGMNGYRDWAEQGVGRRKACAQGNCNAAASQGYSSHGGTWNGGDAMAFDIGNYWAIPWAIFKEECARVGLEVGLITRAIAGIEEPWHIIDRNPYGPAPFGARMRQRFDGVWVLDEAALAGNGAVDFPITILIPDEREDEMLLLNITDDVDGNKKPGYLIWDPRENAFFPPTLNEDAGKGWEKVWGPARKVVRQDWLNATQVAYWITGKPLRAATKPAPPITA